MRGIKYITLIAMLLTSVTMCGQYYPENIAGQGVSHPLFSNATPAYGYSFNRSSDASVSTPTAPEEKKYSNVTIVCLPEDAAYLYGNSGVYEVGSTINFEVYTNYDFKFREWTDNGVQISTSEYVYDYVVTEGDHMIVAHFDFNPQNPSEPDVPVQKYKLTIKSDPDGVAWLYGDGNYKEGDQVYVQAGYPYDYEFIEWTIGSVTVSKDQYFDFTMPANDVELVAHFKYTPGNPNEPAVPENVCHLYGLGVDAKRDTTFYFPIFFESTEGIKGLEVDLKLPQGFVLNKEDIVPSLRVAANTATIGVDDLGGNAYRIKLDSTSPFDGTNGKILDVCLTVPDTATIGNVYPIKFSNAVVKDSISDSISSKGGYIRVHKSLEMHTLDIALKSGWNWISSNINEPGILFARDFAQPIVDYIDRFVGYDAELIKDPVYGLSGTLAEMSPAEGYMMQVNADVDARWKGLRHFTADVEVTLKKGWNWIGYVPTFAIPVAEALEYLTPNEGDVIKDYASFATFENGAWTGTLTQMNPGMGYMYKSVADNSFIYHMVTKKPAAESVTTRIDNLPWKECGNAYPYNMSVIAETVFNGVHVSDASYVIGAFVGDECRGIGQYVNDRLFITIHGDLGNGDVISFKAYDNVSFKEYEIEETVEFGNTIVGSVNKPFVLTSGIDTGIRNNAEGTAFDVKMDNNILYVTGNPEGINRVTVFATTGVKVAETSNYNVSGINLSAVADGTFIVIVRTSGGTVVKKILKIN